MCCMRFCCRRKPPHGFFFSWFAAPRDLHSFPTRRSSDLTLSGGFQGWIKRFLADGAYPFMVPVLRDFVLPRSEEHTSELQSHSDLVCRLLLEKKNPITSHPPTRP